MQHLLEQVQDAYGPHPAGEFWVPHRLGGGAPTLAEANRMDAEEAAEKAARRAHGATGSGTGSPGVGGWNRSSAALEIAAEAAVRATGTRITYHGLENIPATGGAVIAINHTGYVDFLPAALAVDDRKRRMRFMIKAEMQEVKIVDFLIRHTKTIPVDRRAGAGAYAVAVERLRGGELVGVYPEATISRSFELKEFKTGAARMAVEAQVPIIPLIVWGAQRMWTKDHPKAWAATRFRSPSRSVTPIPPVRHRRANSTRRCATAMNAVAASGAGATTRIPRARTGCRDGWAAARRRLAEAKALDEAELAERARRRADRGDAASHDGDSLR